MKEFEQPQTDESETVKDRIKRRGGMPIPRSEPPLDFVPGAYLSPEAIERLDAELHETNKAEMAVRGNDVIAYPPRYKS